MAPSLARRLFAGKQPLEPRRASYGAILDERGTLVDRGVALLAVAPKSYTGEDTLELQVHGSPVVAREVLRVLLVCGARYAQPGEFTRRAFLNGKLDLHAAGAVADLIDAESRSAARAAIANLGGGLTNEVRRLRALLAALLEELAGSIDFPDEVPEPSRSELRSRLDAIAAALEILRRGGEVGRLVREGIGVAIVGPPNAGKSSLLNALLGEERALVSEIAGTTRDTIEESILIDGVQVRLIDTAGIREHADRLESAGIARTQAALAGARIAVLVIDGSQPLSPEVLDLLTATKDRARIVFFNKADIGNRGALQAVLDGAICGTVREHATLAALRAAIAQVGWQGETPDLERPHLACLREIDAVNQALEALDHARGTLQAEVPTDFVVGDLQRVFSLLGHLTGDGATEELLDGIFGRFCIGK